MKDPMSKPRLTVVIRIEREGEVLHEAKQTISRLASDEAVSHAIRDNAALVTRVWEGRKNDRR